MNKSGELVKCYELVSEPVEIKDSKGVRSSNLNDVDYNYLLYTYDEIEIVSDIVNNVKKYIPTFVTIDFAEVYYLLFNKQIINDKEVKIRYIDFLKMAYDCQILEKCSEIIRVKASKLKEYFESGHIFYMNEIPCYYDSKIKCFHRYLKVGNKTIEDDFN